MHFGLKTSVCLLALFNNIYSRSLDNTELVEAFRNARQQNLSQKYEGTGHELHDSHISHQQNEPEAYRHLGVQRKYIAHRKRGISERTGKKTEYGNNGIDKLDQFNSIHTENERTSPDHEREDTFVFQSPENVDTEKDKGDVGESNTNDISIPESLALDGNLEPNDKKANPLNAAHKGEEKYASKEIERNNLKPSMTKNTEDEKLNTEGKYLHSVNTHVSKVLGAKTSVKNNIVVRKTTPIVVSTTEMEGENDYRFKPTSITRGSLDIESTVNNNVYQSTVTEGKTSDHTEVLSNPSQRSSSNPQKESTGGVISFASKPKHASKGLESDIKSTTPRTSEKDNSKTGQSSLQRQTIRSSYSSNTRKLNKVYGSTTTLTAGGADSETATYSPDKHTGQEGYTRAAFVSGIIGGAIVGGCLVLLFFYCKTRCNKLINGDYRRVPMDYDFELNPRFKSHKF